MKASPLSHLATLGLPAFASLFAPWQDKVTSVNLISNWFQPSANLTASIVGPLSCFVTYAILANWSRKDKSLFAIWSFVVFVLSLIVCFIFKVAVENLGQPPVLLSEILWGLWFLLYIVVFIALGSCMLATFRLLI
jgi:hypothetical protein